ncbi:dihydroorotate dehydrogenase electron transfer subunit [Pyrolobus fumarii 1A]|uniref:Dihydroorotate dehydrogenase electron transfer subunit n=1 Tax=Pyrolobus fumarii (strain DSM 11204 / 1A) TaxID=694429 RepID=G0EHM0_PYRF1|nr:dihydroorotate dehydrogenase [Pyrolobus fumarii]AEM39373.1 dihydroorotate dehydrogenase electron transfer subunit [Pyrolobus fumarii 1A]
MGTQFVSVRVMRVKRYGGLAWLRVSPLGFTADPGQFVMLWVPGLEAVPMSIAWMDSLGAEFIVRSVGETTKHIHELKRGDAIGVMGPLGRGISSVMNVHVHKVLLVGGGSGVAPILYTAGVLGARGYDVNIVLGFRSREEAGIREVFEHHGVDVTVVCEDGVGGPCDYEGLVTEPEFVKKLVTSADVVISAGPLPMMKAVYRLAGDKLIAIMESIVKCGVGFCGSCRLWPGGPLLCRDGPVFTASEIRRLLE